MEYLPEALYRAADTREADRRAAQQYGLADGVLMERAGVAAFNLMRERFPRARRVAVVCGPGNNGGDGYVLARLARDAGLCVEVLAPANPDRLTGDAREAYERWHSSAGLAVHGDMSRLDGSDVVVDALFGTGLERLLDGVWKTAVDAINNAHVPVLALDMPSGLHADTGQVLGAAVRAHCTLSFIGLKPGLFTGAGREYAGDIFFDDLSVPTAVFDNLPPMARRITPRNLQGLLKARQRHAHKGDAGRVLVIGGQPGMPGAVRLAGETAYRAGAGLVTLATHPVHAAQIAAVCPELIVHGINDTSELMPLLEQADAVALGPGLGHGEWGRALWDTVSATSRPLVVDADGLRILATKLQKREHWILTPHPGEAAALLDLTTDDVQSDRFRMARVIRERLGGVCVLKGSGTIVADVATPFWLCDRGNPGLATAGSGDVLTGIVAALCAQGLAAADAARLGVWLHAVAGDRAAERGERGLLAGDLMPFVREIANELSHDD